MAKMCVKIVDVPILMYFCHFEVLYRPASGKITSYSCRRSYQLWFEWYNVKIRHELPSEMRKMWGNIRFWDDHDKFENFTKSLKFTQFGIQRLLFTKFHNFTIFGKNKSNWLIPHDIMTTKNMYKKFTQACFGQIFSYLSKYIHQIHWIDPLPSERHLTPVTLQ